MHRRSATLLSVFCALCWGAGTACAVGREDSPRFTERWVYASHNLLVEDNVNQLVALIDRAARSVVRMDHVS